MSINCPRCKSEDVTSYEKDSSDSNARKGVVGGAIAGSILPGIGTIAGAAIGGLAGKFFGDSRKRLVHKCLSCGLSWVFKKKESEVSDNSSDTKAKLHKLEELKNEGLISEEEYNQKRKKILEDF